MEQTCQEWFSDLTKEQKVEISKERPHDDLMMIIMMSFPC